ncbi:MAG: ribonuclease P protein component [Planctomycetaceae bacterium]
MNQPHYRCPKSMHLRSSQDFERIYADGLRAGDDHLLIFATTNDLKVARLGLSISRKHGSAVHRNLKRRRIREAFRRLQHDLPQSYDLIVVPRQRNDSTTQDFRNSLRTLIRKLANRITAAQSDDRAPGPAHGSGANP